MYFARLAGLVLSFSFTIALATSSCATGDEPPGTTSDSVAQNQPPQEAGTAAPAKPLDADGDGYAAGVDCDDRDPAVHPGAVEVCNDKDDNCDGRVDEGFDKDGDGYFACAHAGKAPDCNDALASVHPGAAEVCNGVDDDCNGGVDDIPGRPTTSDYFDPVDPHWKVAGSATLNFPSQNWTRLTPVANDKAGALWWDGNYLFDHFDVSFQFYISSAQTPGADGLAFAWVPGADVRAVGGWATSFGFGGLGGYGVVIDTFQNPNEPAVPYLAVVDGKTVAHLVRVQIPNVRNGAQHSMRIALSSGRLDAWIDGVQYLTGYAIHSYAPFRGHWGFTASTGAAASEHYIQEISMFFPDGQGCVL